MYLEVAYLVLFLLSFLIFFKLVKDSNFSKIFKAGKTNSIIVASVLVSIIGSFLFTSAIIKFIEVIIILVK